MKSFQEALQDGFQQVSQITDPTQLKIYRQEGVRIDDCPIYRFTIRDHTEYDIDLEPIGEEGLFQLAIYKDRVLLTEKIPICQPVKK